MPPSSFPSSPTPAPKGPSCPCGCRRPVDPQRARFVPKGRTAYATAQCAERMVNRRRNRRVFGLELVVCPVCDRPVVRTAQTRRRKYHPHCRPTAKKAFRGRSTHPVGTTSMVRGRGAP